MYVTTICIYQELLTSMAQVCLTGILKVGFVTCVSKTIGAKESAKYERESYLYGTNVSDWYS